MATPRWIASAALNAGEVNFANTVRALDDLGFELSSTDNRLSVIQQTSTNAAVRDAATEALKDARGLDGED